MDTLKHSIKTGLCFGSTSAVITTLGLMVGLHSGTHSKLAVLGGVLTIAIADAFSDALGIHVSEESENKHSTKEIWEATIATFFFKFIFALTFAIPILLFELFIGIIINIIWGLLLLSFVSYKLAKSQKVKAWKVIAEHLIIAGIVIALTHAVGHWILSLFS
jgi:VIT1/CCC1 family predicted Fe2+/Mn2+ transporter